MKRRVLCFGDSNTWGFDALNEQEYGQRFPEDVRWTGRLQTILGDEWTVIEEGLNGRTTVFDDPLRDGLNGLTYLVPCLATHNPLDYMVLMLGTNDCKARFNALPKNIADGMQRLVETAMNAHVWRDQPNILIIAPPHIEEGSDIYPIGRDMGPCSKKSEMLAAEYELWAKEDGCDFLDAAPFTNMNHYDYMHMDIPSHARMAEQVAAIIQKKFK